MVAPSLVRNASLAFCLSASLFFMGCMLFDNDDDSTGNPVLGQWKVPYPTQAFSIEDSLLNSQLISILTERGHLVDGEPVGPFPLELFDSILNAFQCDLPNCDEVLWSEQTYLIFAAESVTTVITREDTLYERRTRPYTYDGDSLYAPEFNGEIGLSSHYRLSAGRDTLHISDFVDGIYTPYVRNTDSLPQ